MRFKWILVAWWLVTGAAMADQPVKLWKWVPDASRLEFVFTQAGSDESGEFKSFNPIFEFDPENLEASQFDVTVSLASVDTGDGDRDEILRSDDMFAVSKWPQAHFQTTSISYKSGNQYLADATLTIRDQTRPIPFPFTLDISKPDANSPAVFHLKADIQLNRLDFGVGKGDWEETTWISDPVQVRVDVTAAREE